MKSRLLPHFRRRPPLALLGVSPEDLVGLAEIAEMFNVRTRTASNYTRRDDFPEPLGQVRGGRVWRREVVEAWGREHLPRPTGRPRKETI